MSVGGGQPKIPSPTLSDVGKGRFARGGRVTILERFDGTMWLEVGRYGTVRDAGTALDEAVAAGADAGTLRVTEVGPKASTRVLLVVGAVVTVAVVVFVLYVFLAG